MDAGFVCPDEKLLCWYRVINMEVVQSICFFSRWSGIPVMMEIGYGVHPLFLTPFHTNDVHVSSYPLDERFVRASIIEAGSKVSAFYSDEILVFAPSIGGRGRYTLEELILPQLNAIETIEQCYQFHKAKAETRPGGLTPLVVDEAIYLNDVAEYPKCKAFVDNMSTSHLMYSARLPGNTSVQDHLKQVQLQAEALGNNGREQYLVLLDQQTQKTIKWLKKMKLLVTS